MGAVLFLSALWFWLCLISEVAHLLCSATMSWRTGTFAFSNFGFVLYPSTINSLTRVESLCLLSKETG